MTTTDERPLCGHRHTAPRSGGGTDSHRCQEFKGHSGDHKAFRSDGTVHRHWPNEEDKVTTLNLDIPPDYKFIDWEHLYLYVGRALMGDHVPLMTASVAKYLEDQARDLRRSADKLEAAAKLLRADQKAKA